MSARFVSSAFVVGGQFYAPTRENRARLEKPGHAFSWRPATLRRRSRQGVVGVAPRACISARDPSTSDVNVIGLDENDDVSEKQSAIKSFADVERLIELAREYDIADFRLEHEGVAVEISLPGGRGFKDGKLLDMPVAATTDVRSVRGADQQYNSAEMVEDSEYADQGLDAMTEEDYYGEDIEEEVPAQEQANEDGVYPSDFVVTSNRVGFFFSGGKGKPPLVNVDDHVAFNQPVCIIEQLGQQYVYLSEVSGTVVKIFIEDGEPVEFGSKVMVIRPD